MIFFILFQIPGNMLQLVWNPEQSFIGHIIHNKSVSVNQSQRNQPDMYFHSFSQYLFFINFVFKMNTFKVSIDSLESKTQLHSITQKVIVFKICSLI